jgi:hypothetical protein
VKFNIDVSQAVSYAGKLAAAVTKVRPEKQTKHYGTILLARTKAYASGRPGPNVITGAYRNSIKIRYETDMATGASAAIVGSDAPQAARLEFGFKGVDSLGRHYNQPPFPHYSRALADMERIYPASVERVASEWVPLP